MITSNPGCFRSNSLESDQEIFDDPNDPIVAPSPVNETNEVLHEVDCQF